MESGRIQEVPLDLYEDEWAGQTIAEMKAADKYQEFTVKEVTKYGDGYSITTEDSTGFGIPDNGIEPEPGMRGRIYSPGFGSQFHGVDLDGQEVFWRTPMERDANRVKWLAGRDRRQREEFAEQKAKLDADFEALPEPLKARIQRFRDADPGFRVTGESYELFTCVEGAKFLKRAQRAVETGRYDEEVAEFFAGRDGEGDWVWDRPTGDPVADWLLWAWWTGGSDEAGYDHKKQEKLLDNSGGHSGNTFGGAMMLAIRMTQGEAV